MRYWDTSALVPLVVDEPGTALVRSWLREDPQVVTWGLTRLEIVSAVERRLREGSITEGQRREALSRFTTLADAWGEIVDLLAVRARAVPLVARHPLRAADAVQLGAAIVAAEADPPSLAFACLDRDLARAAEREGFLVLSWPV
jgi:predicted nucleic acid-binding protein